MRRASRRLAAAAAAMLASACTTHAPAVRGAADVPTAAAHGSSTTPAAAPSIPADGGFVASDGVRIHYLTLGTHGSPVVLIHGLAVDARASWFESGVAEALATRHRVVAIDLRGHGESEKPHDPARYGDRLWRDVLELMDSLDIRRAHVHGYSFGGAMIHELLAHHPDRFLSAAFGGSGVPETDSARLASLPAEPPAPESAEQAAATKVVQRITAGNDTIALRALLASPPQGRTPLDVAALRLPLLVIVGEYDQPVRRTQRLRREARDFTSVVLPGKSHRTAAVPGFMPPEYIATLTRFIDSHDTPP